MYAVIKTGGKQYPVKAGETIDVELLHQEVGALVEFSEVLFVANGESKEVGNPSVAGYIVKGQVIGASAGEKIESIKYKPSHNEVRKFGHRQHYTRVKITEIAKV